jgi:hypothetical protein
MVPPRFRYAALIPTITATNWHEQPPWHGPPTLTATLLALSRPTLLLALIPTVTGPMRNTNFSHPARRRHSFGRPATHLAYRRGRMITDTKKSHQGIPEHNWENVTCIHIYYKYTKNPTQDRTLTRSLPSLRLAALRRLPARLVPSLKNTGLQVRLDFHSLESRTFCAS